MYQRGRPRRTVASRLRHPSRSDGSDSRSRAGNADATAHSAPPKRLAGFHETFKELAKARDGLLNSLAMFLGAIVKRHPLWVTARPGGRLPVTQLRVRSLPNGVLVADAFSLVRWRM